MLGGAAVCAAEVGPAPVLVELFTSQGCGSCPPADEVLSTWGREAFERGEIVPLSFHVDYWDKGGWKDPFGDRAYTNRQKQYAGVFKSEAVYTPQMVLGGRVEFNGANLPRAKEELPSLRTAAPPVQFQMSAAAGHEYLNVSVKARSSNPDGGQKGILEAFVAVFENDLETDVLQGENWGRALRNDFVVRRLKTLGFLTLSSKQEAHWTADIFLDPSWKRQNLGVAVFLQDAETLAVSAVKAISPL